MPFEAKNKFEINDRVELLINSPDGNEYLHIGDTGTVCDLRASIVGVRWDKYHAIGHTCNDHCELGHGWEVYSIYIELITEDEIQQSDSDISVLIPI